MNVHTDLSFLQLVLQASVVVQAVMALLVFLSLWSWWQIFLKMFQIRRAERDTGRFEDEFWKGGDLAELYQRSGQSRGGSGLEDIDVQLANGTLDPGESVVLFQTGSGLKTHELASRV